MGLDRRVPVLPVLQIDYGLACIARLEQAPMPERLHYLYLRSFSRKREISKGRVGRHSVTRFRGHLFWRVVLQAGHRFRGPTGKMMQSSTCLDLKVPHCVGMELTRFHSNLRARADKTFGPGGFDLAFQISLGAVLNSYPDVDLP